MKPIIRITILFVLLGGVSSVCPLFAEETETLDNATVIEMVKAGLGESVVVGKISSSPCNFDVSVSALIKLKAANVPDAVINAMQGTMKASKAGGARGRASESNDPNAAHEAGIWLYEENEGKPKMTKLEPNVYSQSKQGIAIFAQYGQTSKTKAVLGGAHAALKTTNRHPLFYFYFEKTDTGLSDTKDSATSPNEFTFAQFEVNNKDNHRALVVGQFNAYSGGQSGPEDKAVRSFKSEKLAPGIYKVEASQELASGEYGIFYTASQAGHAFGGVGQRSNKVFDFGIESPPEPEPIKNSDKKTDRKSDVKPGGKASQR